jgi:hypothetical protein
MQTPGHRCRRPGALLVNEFRPPAAAAIVTEIED